ncbi:short-chain dehydrogenase/reductase-like protein SDR [Plenodomus tracheiphilus IPT5]|uniref:Short-chain dehydrogenase/reductase-like protein SDR n=1 Tax=Plenodomus tracheiphilus IPT5 TaxID=1408161 RepID=A0A6A7BAX1_9PLEO|nr:short-chain dehydrogenase/reductase-like protein SDR [Plenodomus tracheiphilus IPT5]
MSDSTKYLSKLRGARVLVIGGSSGIGFCVAEACVEHGAIVTVSSSNQDRVSKAVERLKGSYPSAKERVFGLPVDLSSADTLEVELKKLLENTKEKLGGEKLDHVVFTAGNTIPTVLLEDMTMKNIVKAGQVRFFAPLLLAKFLPTYLNESYKSSYTITTGTTSEKPVPNWSVVGSYAGGHHSMVRNLALDLKPIRVNGVSPGAVNTELWNMPANQKDIVLKAVAEKMTTGRPGQPEDVAESYLVVMKDVNMDGSVVRTDGGYMLM